MSLYDIVMLVIFFGAIWFGFWKGLSWQIASLAAIFVSYFVAVTFPDAIAPHISAEAPWNRFAAMLILFLGTSMVIWMIFASVSKSIKKMELKGFDRQTGAMLGAVKGAVLCMVVTMFSVSLMGQSARDAVHRSLTGGWVVSGMQMLSSFAPQGLSQYIDQSLPKLTNDEGELPTPKNPFEKDSTSWQAQGQQGIQGQFQTTPTSQAGFQNSPTPQYGNTQYGGFNNQQQNGQYQNNNGQYQNNQYQNGQYTNGQYQNNQYPNNGQYQNNQYSNGQFQGQFQNNQQYQNQNQTGTYQAPQSYGTNNTYGTQPQSNNTANGNGNGWGWDRGFESGTPAQQPAPTNNQNGWPYNQQQQQQQPQSNNGWFKGAPTVSQGEDGWPELNVKINAKDAIQQYGPAALEAVKNAAQTVIENSQQ